MSVESTNPNPRSFLAASAAVAAASPLPAQIAADTAIRPFRVNVPEADVTDLRRRIKETRWPERETVTDATQGVQLATTQKLAHYWATEYDWRKCRGETECFAEFYHRDRWARHSLHSRSFEA